VLRPTTKSRPACAYSRILLTDNLLTDTSNLFIKEKVETALTELDVRVALPNSAEKTAAQAKVYADSVKACVDVDDCAGVTVWDFWDPVSWVPDSFPGKWSRTLIFTESLTDVAVSL
jgi:GH35 family endo-1,4-beta-xylanase